MAAMSMPAISVRKPSDGRIESAEITFSDERLAVPLRLSKGVISEITYAEVSIGWLTRQGEHARGRGAILLSDLWAFPHPTLDHAAKDRAMRALCTTLAELLPADGDYGDPLQKHHWLEACLANAVAAVEAQEGWRVGTLPQLAALNCLSPFDAAIHDGWGRAIGGSVYQLYTGDWLNADLSHYLKGELAGRYPGDYLTPRRTSLRIQHVVGVGDALTPDPALVPALPDLPADLTSWVKRDALSSFKIKSKGQDPLVDAQRVAAVYNTVRAAQSSDQPIHLSLDPNEGCPDAAFVLETLDVLAHDAPEAYAALDYIEQPTGRDLASYTFTLHEVAARKPVILDESFDSLAILPRMAAQGWSGIAVKTCKGQSTALIAYCWAKAHHLHVTLQDLTNPGRALVHSANLCAHLALMVDAFECNSRQYMPHARAAEQAEYPAYFHGLNGILGLPAESNSGLY
jgi:L-alanine-DL-glutamate epimerase-like enolase superfamily enzyme